MVIIPHLLVYAPPQNWPPKTTGRLPQWEGIKKFTQTMQKDSLTLSLLWFVFVFDHVWMTMLASIFLVVVCTCTWADVYPCAQAAATGQCPCKTGNKCCTDIGCAVMEFVPCFHGRLGPLEGNWSNCNKKVNSPSRSWSYPRNRFGIVHVPVLECVCYYHLCIVECRERKASEAFVTTTCWD